MVSSENFFVLFLSAVFFSKSPFQKIIFRNAIRETNSLDPDQARHSVGPDPVPNYLQNLSADDTRRQRVEQLI